MIGRMRHVVRLLTATTSDDGEGGQSVTWAQGPYLAAEIRPASAREQAIAGGVQTMASHILSMHYDSRITTLVRFARVDPAGNDLQVVGVRDQDGRQRFLDVDCMEVL